MTQTRGEYIIGTDFNPSNNGAVDQVKQKAAEFYNLIDELTPMTSVSTTAGSAQQAEVYRLKREALWKLEQAAMLAVKAITKPEWK